MNQNNEKYKRAFFKRDKMNKTELIEKLELLKQATNPSSFILDYGCIHFDGKTLSATDGTTTIITSNPLPEQSFSVRVDALLNLLTNIDAEEITLDVKETSLAVRTKRIQGKFSISKPRHIEFNTPKVLNKIEDCSKLLEAIYLCSFGTSKVKTSGSIGGVRIEGDSVYSTDRFRIYKYKMDNDSNIPNISIPKNFVDVLHKVENRVAQYGIVDSSFFVVLNDGTTIQTTIFSEGYPNLNQYFENIDLSKFKALNFESKLNTVLEKHLKSVLQSIDSNDKEIKFTLAGNVCTLHSQDRDEDKLVERGRVEEELELSEDVGNFSFTANPILLQEVLQHCEGKFLYHPEDKVILINAGKLQVLVQTKE
jgi:hypothetical protein